MKLKIFLVKLISLYQKTISPDTGFLKKIGVFKGSVCVFYPSCSEYTKEALEKYGVLKGISLGIKRLSHCHPWQKKHIDPLK